MAWLYTANSVIEAIDAGRQGLCVCLAVALFEGICPHRLTQYIRLEAMTLETLANYAGLLGEVFLLLV